MTTPTGKRSVSVIEHILLDMFIVALLAAGIIHWHTSRTTTRLLQMNEEKEIEAIWEKQHIDELQESVDTVNSSYSELLELNVEMARKLTEMEKQLADEENARLRSEINAASANLRGGERHKYKIGDVIELGNFSPSAGGQARPLQFVPPFKVDKRLPDGTYEVVRVTDGFRTKGVKETSMRTYIPYAPGMDAVCNIGGFGEGKERFIPCEIKGYVPRSSRGAMVLQGQYEVHIHAHQELDSHDTRLLVWKVMGKR